MRRKRGGLFSLSPQAGRGTGSAQSLSYNQSLEAAATGTSGQIVRTVGSPQPLRQVVATVDGAALASAKKIYLALNKPRGIVTTASDEKDRATVYSLLPVDLPWVAKADAVLRLPGPSRGADAEEAFAQAHGIPVFREIRDLFQLLPRTRP